MSSDRSSLVSPQFTAAVREITERSVFAGARFGVAVCEAAGGRPIYQHNAHDIFQAASTTKIPTVAYALALLGRDFRFHTRLVRQGTIDSAGTLQGDLILVASGDPNLSGRVAPNDKLDFKDYDHSIGAPKARAVERNPLQVIEAFARGAREAGIRRITGTVLVDVSLFPGDFRELGTLTTVSPIVINDNLIDIEVTAGERAGEALSYRISPLSGYVRFIDRATTGEKGSRQTLAFSSERREADGTWSVVITGTVPAGTTCLLGFGVESPSRFARTLLVEALATAGIVVEGGLFGPSVTSNAVPANAEVVFEHVSPPLIEATKVVLKVSQNLHAEVLMRVIGATLRGAKGVDAATAAYESGLELLKRWGVDTAGAVQSDAAGGIGYFSPDFMCRLLVRIAASDIHEAFVYCLPIMGRDGTLRDIQTTSIAAGHVLAKTGTISYDDPLNKALFYSAKGLAGYITTKSGRRTAFALYLNNYQRGPSSELDPNHPGQVLGAIAAAVYEHL